ncbi:glucose/arabinose dehydrogenase [Litorivivens lipolytica]|uniref:Glucose/arabinose dehydrogenase n=1 Tax=Litorivivens lipolytica TaxID=1524264 RepID=A0A7W4W3V4_9GAMM|nr:PQQ-dependent sugar dehydrogenase [Litorivivens lipolytica]MBB3046845.1 glucose/arabinose dehydrogenase [Litorivivens lipolytica]
MKSTTALMRLLLSTLLVGLLSACNNATADFRAELVTDGVRSPWGVAWLPSGDMLITSRRGEFYRLTAHGKLQAIAGLPEVDVNGQGGLLDVAVHPDYADNGWIYLSYSSPAGEGRGSNTAVLRGRLQDKTLVDSKVLYKGEPNSGRGQHYGSRIVLDGKGHLYFSIGDRGARDENPQDLSKDGGKIYRLTDDGQVPDDNPFVVQKNALPAIYSLGHRNPQGMALNPKTGELWLHEHGPRGGDEINIVKAGANYGWPILSYGVNYSGTRFAEGQTREGYESPIHYWVPSIAPSGMTFVTSEHYPEWQGHLLVGSLKFGYVVLCRLDGDRVVRTEQVLEGIGRVRDIKQGPTGLIYVVTENNGIFRIPSRKG